MPSSKKIVGIVRTGKDGREAPTNTFLKKQGKRDNGNTYVLKQGTGRKLEVSSYENTGKPLLKAKVAGIFEVRGSKDKRYPYSKERAKMDSKVKEKTAEVQRRLSSYAKNYYKNNSQ